MNNKIYYLAHPYSPQDGSLTYSPSGQNQVKNNVMRSIELTNKLMDKGFNIFNPLTHSHSLDSQKHRKSEFWYDLDLLFLERFDGIIMSPEWQHSKGCMKEFQFALDLVRNMESFEILFYNLIMGRI